MQKKIASFKDDFAFLSNFYPCQITHNISGCPFTFGSVEAAYQACKCKYLSEAIQFTKMRPGEAKKAGKEVNLVEGWDGSRLRTMGTLLAKKFVRGSELATRLIATGKAYIEEGNTWGDTFWGICDGKGDNNLGLLLMETREDVQQDFVPRSTPYNVDVSKKPKDLAGCLTHAGTTYYARGWYYLRVVGEVIGPFGTEDEAITHWVESDLGQLVKQQKAIELRIDLETPEDSLFEEVPS